jgi:hypothetical protein
LIQPEISDDRGVAKKLRLAVATYLKWMRIILWRVHNLTVLRWGIRMDADPKETARYLADHAAELARLAREQGFETLAYLLEMARIEAMRLAAIA